MIKLSSLFQDNMIFQREKPVPVWGTADPGTKITVGIQGKTAAGRADEQGNWRLTLPPLSASESERLTITDGQSFLHIYNVAVGEVWIAGGQSNMEFWMRYEKNRAEEGLACPDNRLRFYDVPKVCYDNQLDEFDYSRMGVWRVAAEADLDYFSAVAYYFQKELSAELDVPAGIIGCNWGGTVSAAWMDRDTVMRIGGPWHDWLRQRTAYHDMDAYLASLHGKPVNDHGNPFGDYFLENVLPRTLTDEEAIEFFDTLPDDTAAIYNDYMTNPQPQSVPGSLYEHMVKTIAPFPVRGVLWYQGEGDDEFGLSAHYAVMLAGLIGDWRKLWHDETAAFPDCQEGGLRCGKTGNPADNEVMPFLVVQIPGFLSWLGDQSCNDLALLRRCQEEVCDSVPNTWLCSASDAGAKTDAHPKDKSAIGHRLALLARNHVYGEDVACDAPRAVAARKDGRRIIVTFENAGDGLVIKGERINALEITGRKEHHDFEAGTDGVRLVLELKSCACENAADGSFADGPAGPLTISFAQTSWYRVNLYNSAGIPAIPFMFTL